MSGYYNTHLRKTADPTPISKAKMERGMVVKLKYKPKNKTPKLYLVLVLQPKWPNSTEGKLHGLSLDNIPPKIGIGNEDGKPIFSLTIRWRGNIYTEIFRQKNINDFNIWKCTNKTYIFSQSEYNLLFLEEIELSDITNIKHLISNKNLVSIFNFTNEGSISANILSEYAELI